MHRVSDCVHGSTGIGGDLLSLRTDAPAGPTYPLDGANSPPTWTIVFYLLRKGVKPPVLVLCLAFRHRKVRLYYDDHSLSTFMMMRFRYLFLPFAWVGYRCTYDSPSSNGCLKRLEVEHSMRCFLGFIVCRFTPYTPHTSRL